MLCIEPCDGFFTGNTRVRLKYSGFRLSALEKYPELAYFSVKTYAVFIKQSTTAMAYGPINDFLSGLSLDKQRVIADALILMNSYVKDASISAPEAIVKCGQVLNTLDKTIGLCDAFEHYVQSGAIVISDMSEAGSRPQDKKDMTFLQEEAAVITAITLLSKLMSPVLGEFIYQYAGELNNKSKENAAAAIFTFLYNRKYRELINKLDHYVNKLVVNRCKDDLSIHYLGYTPDRTTRIILDTLFVKKFVSIDLHRDDGNVIKYIASCTKSYLESQGKSGASQEIVRYIADPTDQDMSEETNNSRLEAEAVASAKPADVVPLSRFSAEWGIEYAIKEHNLDPQLVEKMFLHYQKSPSVITPIMLYMIASYFGPYIGGGSAVYMIDGILTLKLCAVLQLIVIKRGFLTLAHGLTLTRTAMDRSSQMSDFVFMNTWRSSTEYSECKKVITPGFGEVSWDNEIKDIAASLTTTTYIYNTSPDVYELLHQENTNHKQFNDNLNLVLEILKFIKELWVERSDPEDD